MNAEGANYWPAQFTRYKIVINATGDEISTGYLDGIGCTGYLAAISNTEYKIKIGTLVYRSGAGLIYVHPDNNIWGTSAGYTYYNSYKSTGNLTNNSHNTIPIYETALDAKTNLMPIMGKVHDKYDILAYPAGKNVFIHTDCNTSRGAGASHCCGLHDEADPAVWNVPNTANICIAGGWYDNTSTTGWKFMVGHEIGHAISLSHSGPYTSIFGHYNHGGMCDCGMIVTGGSEHCLQSAEPILAGESEGFAHFFSTALFNDRVEDNAFFVYPKESTKRNTQANLWYTALPESVWLPWLQGYPGDVYHEKWLERRCSDIANRGVELDWLHFFYELWTINSVYQFSIAEMLDVWEGTTDDESKLWQSLVDEIENSDKKYLFGIVGGLAGVNH